VTLKVLVEAYECSPARGHAPGAAWQIVRRLARKHSLWIVTDKTQYGDEILSHVARQPEISRSCHFVFIPGRIRGQQGRYRPAIPVRATLDYRAWLRAAYDEASRLHREITFDLTHHLRGDSFREPGLLWKLPCRLFGGQWGDHRCSVAVDGVHGCPQAGCSRFEEWDYSCQIRFSRKVRLAARGAASVLAQSRWIAGCCARFLA